MGRIPVALKTMSIRTLLELRNRIEAVLSGKVGEERRVLESELAKLKRYERGGTRSKYFGRGSRGKVVPKYRNPENPSETWAGRGLKPRWLAAAIKSGKKLDDFSFAASCRRRRHGKKYVLCKDCQGTQLLIRRSRRDESAKDDLLSEGKIDSVGKVFVENQRDRQSSHNICGRRDLGEGASATD
jgi:DNA-binding protein H-NS